MPCAGDNGKRPQVKWTHYQSNIANKRIVDAWKQKHPTANIGVVTGALSDITVIDCDNPNTPLQALESQFGQSPIVVKTPRGGIHLYYKYNYEGNCLVPYSDDVLQCRDIDKEKLWDKYYTSAPDVARHMDWPATSFRMRIF